MRTNVYYGGAESLESLSPGMDCGGLGFAFDLQRFADNDVVLVVKDGDKVTLNLNTERQGNDRWLLLPNGEPINLSALSSSDTKLNVKDSAGHTYGTVDWRGFVTLSSPGEGAAPINEVSAQGNVAIFNGKYLAEKTKCSHVRVEQFDVLKVFKDDNQNGAFVSVAQNSDAVAEMVYHRDGYLVSGKNGRVGIEGTYAVLSGDTYVEDKGAGSCVLLADSEGKLTLVVGDFFANGAISVYADSYTALRDEAGKRLAVFNTPVYKNGAMVVEEFKGIYDGDNKKISPTQGSFSVFGEDGGVYCCVVNDKDETMELWETDVYGNPTGLVTRRAYAEIDKVSFTLLEDVSSLSGDNDYGLTLDIKTVTVTATDTLSLIEPPEGMDTVIYQNEDGSTRFATLRKTDEGYELVAGAETVTVDRANLTGNLTLTQGEVMLASGKIIVAGTEYTVGDNGATLALGGDNKDRAVLTAGEVVLSTDKSIYVGDKKYTAATTNTVLTLKDGKTELAAGRVVLDYADGVGGSSVYVNDKQYTAAGTGATLALDESGTVELYDGTVWFAAGGSVKGSYGTYTAAGTGATVSLTETYDISLEGGEVSLTGRSSIYVGETYYSVSENGTATLAYAGTNEAKLVSGEVELKGDKKILIGEKEYTAYETGATFALAADGTAALKNGGISLAGGDSFAIDGTTYTAGQEGAALYVDGTGNTGTELRSGEVAFAAGSIVIGGNKYKAQGNASMAVGQQGTVLTAGAVELDSGDYVTVGATKYFFEAGTAVGVAGDKAELLSGEVYLGKDKSILVDGCVYTGNETEVPAQLAYDGEGSAVKLELGFVKFDNGSLEAGGVVYTTETGAAISTIGSEKVWLDEGTVKFAKGTIYVTNDDVDCAYTAQDGATVALGEDRQVKVGLEKEESILIDGEEYKAGGAGATLTHSDGKIELTAGEVVLGENESIFAGGTEYTAGEAGATLNRNGHKTELADGAVVLGKDKSIWAGGREYTALADGTAIALADDGQVQLAEGTQAQVSGLGTIIIIKGTCDVNSDGSLTGLADGTSLTLEQDGEEYEMSVSEGELTVTKDGVTKTTPLEEGASIDDDLLEELYPSDPSQPLIIKPTPGKTKRPESYDVSKDTIKLAKVSGTLNPDEIIITGDGLLTYGKTYAQGLAANGVIDLSEAEQGKDYYEARLTDKDGNNKQLVAWSGSDGAVLDMRSETKGVVMKDGGNGERDTFYGGTGRDTITLGSEDIARGGEGRDVIIIGAGAKGAEVALQNGGGHDEVQGFGFGFDEAASIVNLEDSSGLSALSVDNSGRLKTEGATLEFVGKNLKASNQTDLLMRTADGLHKISMGTKMAPAGDEVADVYFGTGSKAELDFSNFSTDELTLDLNNNWGGTTAEVHGVKKVTGAREADNILIGQDGKSNAIIGGDGGANSLYGGWGGNDTLVGSASSEDTFYFGLDSGRDTVENFGTEDTLHFLDGNYAGASLDRNGHLKFRWSDGQGHTASLTLDGDVRDKVINYDFGDGAHGAKFGSRLTITDDTADFVNYYKSSGGQGELVLSGTDAKSVWLDGSQGVAYDGFRKVDASSMEGDALLAGGERSEELIAGKGDSSLWGGTGNTNDTMIGGRGENEFYFGKGEGKDLITSSNNDDKVMLYNVTLADIDGSATGVKDGRMVIALTDGSTLTIENYKSHGAETFQLADSTWTYDKQTGGWAQVKQG